MSDTTQHYSASDITSAEEEESYQAAEYDVFFNSEDTETEAEAYDAYTLTATETDADLLQQIGLTNELLGTVIALLILFFIFSVMRFLYRLLLDNIFHYL